MFNSIKAPWVTKHLVESTEKFLASIEKDVFCNAELTKTLSPRDKVKTVTEVIKARQDWENGKQRIRAKADLWDKIVWAFNPW